MQGYRLYFVNPDGHIKRVVAVECANDKEALETAEHHRNELAIELWHRARKLKVLPPSTD